MVRSKQKALSFSGRLTPLTGSGASVSSTPATTKTGSPGDLLPNKESAFDAVSLSEVGEYVNKCTQDDNNTYNQSAFKREVIR